MFKVHHFKIRSEFAIPKLLGLKRFEIRFNDREFCVGDYVSYTCIDDSFVDSCIKDKLYIISYLTDFEQKLGYVVFSEIEVFKK